MLASLTCLRPILLFAAEETPEAKKNLAELAPAIGLGAQTELLGPFADSSGILVSYDARWIQLEGDASVIIREDKPTNVSQKNEYFLGLRAYVPMHRATLADFNLGAGVAGALQIPPSGKHVTSLLMLVGAKVRVFFDENVCITGSLDAELILSEDGNIFHASAFPIAAAGFTYYFR